MNTNISMSRVYSIVKYVVLIVAASVLLVISVINNFIKSSVLCSLVLFLLVSYIIIIGNNRFPFINNVIISCKNIINKTIYRLFVMIILLSIIITYFIIMYDKSTNKNYNYFSNKYSEEISFSNSHIMNIIKLDSNTTRIFLSGYMSLDLGQDLSKLITVLKSIKDGIDENGFTGEKEQAIDVINEIIDSSSKTLSNIEYTNSKVFNEYLLSVIGIYSKIESNSKDLLNVINSDFTGSDYSEYLNNMTEEFSNISDSYMYNLGLFITNSSNTCIVNIILYLIMLQCLSSIIIFISASIIKYIRDKRNIM